MGKQVVVCCSGVLLVRTLYLPNCPLPLFLLSTLNDYYHSPVHLCPQRSRFSVLGFAASFSMTPASLCRTDARLMID